MLATNQRENKGETLPFSILAKPLPAELQEMVIRHLYGLKGIQVEERFLHPPTDDQRLITDSLRSCSLVCKGWFLFCRQLLIRNIHVSSRNRLEDMISYKPFDSLGSPYPHIVNMVLGSTPGVTDSRPFHHLTLHYFATKLPALIALYICGDISRMLPVPKSLCMQLGLFRSLANLRLIHIRFQSFWDLRRLVVSPPSLSSLWLRDISWPSLFATPLRVPSLLSTARRLSEVKMSDVPRPWEIFWFWTTSYTPKTSGSIQSSTQEHPYPAFTTHDTIIIEQLIQKFLPPVRASRVHWSYHGKRQDCESSGRATLPLKIIYHDLFVTGEISYIDSDCSDNEVRATVRALTSRGKLPRSPTYPVNRVGLIYLLFCSNLLPPSNWKDVDELCNSLQDLQTIHLSVSNTVSERETAIQEVLRSMTLLRARNNLSLSFTVDGVVVEKSDFDKADREGWWSTWGVSVSLIPPKYGLSQ